MRSTPANEVIGERIRDKIAASKRKGMWMGGVPPLGYRAQDRKEPADPARLKALLGPYPSEGHDLLAGQSARRQCQE